MPSNLQNHMEIYDEEAYNHSFGFSDDGYDDMDFEEDELTLDEQDDDTND